MRRFILLVMLFSILLGAAPVFAGSGDQMTPNGIKRIGLGARVRAGENMEDVDVAVIDTGIDSHHPDLNIKGGYDCTGEWKAKPLYDDFGHLNPEWQDYNGHGTHVSGTIAALNDNKGVVGVAPGARLWAVKVLNGEGSGSLESVICGLKWVKDHADVIDVANMSLGASGFTVSTSYCTHTNSNPDDVDPRLRTGEHLYQIVADEYTNAHPELEMTEFGADYLMHQAVCDVVDAGVLIAVAAGNGGQDTTDGRPASYPEAVTVSSFADFDGDSGGFAGSEATCSAKGWDDRFFGDYDNSVHPLADSYHGTNVDIAAPGVCVLSTWPAGTYTYLTGTSMATPHVTGAIALYKSYYPDANVLEVEGWLKYCGEAQPTHFDDPDSWHEPLLHICDLPADKKS